MIDLLILLSCINVGTQYNYMCKKSIEAALIQSDIRESILLVERYYQSKANKIINKFIPKSIGAIVAFGYNIVYKREVTLGFTFHPISDTIVLQGKQTGMSVNLGWAF